MQKMKDFAMIKDIEANIESIRNKHPEKIRIDHFSKRKTNDIFREQIIYALGGEKKYSSNVLANP